MKTATEARQTQLNHFVGTWHTTGQSLSGENDGQHIEGLDTYEWLPGKHYLMHTVDVLIGETRQHSLEMIGYDEKSHTITGRSFGNNGAYTKMSFDLRGDEILINSPDLRFNGRFIDNFNKISGIWETLTENGWRAIMELTLIKRA